jgi:hypothetical protein
MMAIRGPLVLSIAALLAACVAGSGESHLTPVPVATNGPAACYAQASFTPQEQRVTIQHQSTTQRMGELAACELAKQEVANRAAGTCQTRFGSRTDIRNLTARTQFNGGTSLCTCRDAGLFMQCDLEGDVICNFEAADPASAPACL